MAKFQLENFSRSYNIKPTFLHQLPEAKELFEIVANELQILPIIIEKDYWIMHCLWGMQQQGIRFDMKGGTSLSKGFGIIERFSEDIDILIYPKDSSEVKIGKNQNNSSHIDSRKQFFDKTTLELNVPGLKFKRDHNFDDTEKMRGGGIRAEYDSLFSSIVGLKEGIVLELGFDQTVPNIACDITSWVFKKAQSLKISVIDNQANEVPCYAPEYSFVEKLQAISTKYRLQQQNKTMPVNFLRHYYDIYKLLDNERVQKFIGSDAYLEHKRKRFRSGDEVEINKNEAFIIPDPKIKKLYSEEFQKKSAIYFGQQPEFEAILERLNSYLNIL